MAYTNLDNLQNISAINLSFDNLTNPQTAINHLKVISQNSVGNTWFIGGIFLIFLMLIWWLYQDTGKFGFDLTRSIFISSSFCLLISIAFLLSPFINTVLPIIWFATVWVITGIAIMKLREKNL